MPSNPKGVGLNPNANSFQPRATVTQPPNSNYANSFQPRAAVTQPPNSNYANSLLSQSEQCWKGLGESDDVHLNGCMMFIRSESYADYPPEDRKHCFPACLRRALELSFLQFQTLHEDYKHKGPALFYKFVSPNRVRISMPLCLRKAFLNYFDSRGGGATLTSTGWGMPGNIGNFPRERKNDHDPWVSEKYSRMIITESLNYLDITSCNHVPKKPGDTRNLNLRLRLAGIGDLTSTSDNPPLISDRNMWLTLYKDGELGETESEPVRFTVKFPTDKDVATTDDVLQFTLKNGMQIQTHLSVNIRRPQPSVDADRELQNFLESKGLAQPPYSNNSPVAQSSVPVATSAIPPAPPMSVAAPAIPAAPPVPVAAPAIPAVGNQKRMYRIQILSITTPVTEPVVKKNYNFVICLEDADGNLVKLHPGMKIQTSSPIISLGCYELSHPAKIATRILNLEKGTNGDMIAKNARHSLIAADSKLEFPFEYKYYGFAPTVITVSADMCFILQPLMLDRSPTGDEHTPPNLGALGDPNTFFWKPTPIPGDEELDAELESLFNGIIDTP